MASVTFSLGDLIRLARNANEKALLKELESDGAETTAVIVAVERVTGMEDHTYSVTMEADGRRYTQKTDSYILEANDIGRKLPILISRKDPSVFWADFSRIMLDGETERSAKEAYTPMSREQAEQLVRKPTDACISGVILIAVSLPLLWFFFIFGHVRLTLNAMMLWLIPVLMPVTGIFVIAWGVWRYRHRCWLCRNGRQLSCRILDAEYKMLLNKDPVYSIHFALEDRTCQSRVRLKLYDSELAGKWATVFESPTKQGDYYLVEESIRSAASPS